MNKSRVVIFITIIACILFYGCGGGSSSGGGGTYLPPQSVFTPTITPTTTPTVITTATPTITPTVTSTVTVTPTTTPTVTPTTPPSGYTDITDPTPKQRYSLIVGSNSASLSACDTDATEMHNSLSPSEINSVWLGSQQTRLLTSDGVTKEKVLSYIADYGSKASENDLFLFYYSGHGSGGSIKPGGEAISASVLANHLIKHFKEYTKKIIIIDCCDSGLAIQSLKGVKNITILTATAENKIQDSNEGTASGKFFSENGFDVNEHYHQNGFFTMFLLYAIGNSGDTLGNHNIAENGSIALKDAFDFAQKWTKSYMNYNDLLQEPSYYTNYVVDPSHHPIILKGSIPQQ